MYKSIFTLLVVTIFLLRVNAQNTVRFNVSTFDAIPLTGAGFENGKNLKGGFWNAHHYFRNSYDTAWKVWSGFSISNTKDTITPDFTNEYSSITGGGINGTPNYAVCYGGGILVPEKTSGFTGFYITNTTYAYHSLKNGTVFSKKFGGNSGSDKDWYRLKIYNYLGGLKSDSILFYLADFQNDDNTKDYILKTWEWLDLSQFSKTDSLIFTFESSDVGQFGINTPTYFVMDDFNTVQPDNINMAPGLGFKENDFYSLGNVWNGESDTSGGFVYGKLYFENRYNTEWNSWSGWAVSKDKDTSKIGFTSQYSSITAGGASSKFGTDSGFAVSYGRSVIRMPYKKGGWPVTYLRFAYTNNTYAYKSIKNGDAFSKKFGGILGTDPDLFRLFVIGYDDKGIAVDTLGIDEMKDEMALADYRMGRNYLNKNWTYHISGGFKKNIVRMEFQLESTDIGPFGMNTPEFFCLDNLFEYPIESVKSTLSQVLKVYPNPATDYVILDLTDVKSLNVFDLQGREVMNIISPETNKIDISGLPVGIYSLRAESGKGISTGRFVKYNP